MAHGADDSGATQRQVLYGLGALVLVLALLVGILSLTDDGDDTTPSTTTSSTSASTSSTSTTAAPATTIPDAELDIVMFPARDGARTFNDPRLVARAFAVDLLGFTDPVVGLYTAGDSRSGEVAIRVAEAGPPTVVLVRQLSNDNWYVLGAQAEPIVLTTPAAGTRLVAPQPLLGEAYAFEGTVNVSLYVDGTDDPIAQTVVTGRGDGILGPFAGEIDYTAPSGTTRGTLVLRSLGGEDGEATMAATAIRVTL
jgi:hypothetical protein